MLPMLSLTTSQILQKLADRIPLTNINPKDIIYKIPRQLSLDSVYFNQAALIAIKNIIRKLPNKTSSGVDNISNKLVKNLSKTLIVPSYIIFNKSLIDGIFPDAMKRAEIFPLYKCKESYLLNNY